MVDADFSGYATKAGLRCSDGRTITAEAFAHMDGATVPLVWQHTHDKIDNVLGHAVLESRDDGMYAQGFFNGTKAGEIARALVEHGDVKALSIFANGLVEKNKLVQHGEIRELSLVLAGANPGAFIEHIRIQHSSDPDDFDILEGDAIISAMVPLEHGVLTDDNAGEGDGEGDDTGGEGDDLSHANADDTLEDVWNTFDEDQKRLVHYLVGTAADAAANSSTTDAAHSALTDDGTTLVDDKEGSTTMRHTVFDKNADAGSMTGAAVAGSVLSHSELKEVLASAVKLGSFKEAFKEAALAHSITDIELLFPDAKAITDSPQFISRRMEWVAAVLNGTKHSPFAKVKTLLADITAEEARAKGYIKGQQKVEEVLVLLRRTTGPTTIYKKQALDRDDIIDITEIDVVLWLKAEMRLMIEEEVARAILVGDGRSVLSTDKVKDPAGSTDGDGIRSILHDDDLYAVKYPLAANVQPGDAIKGFVRARSKYRGSGKPSLFISDSFLTDLMLLEDKFGRALYETEQALMDKLRVKEIVPVDLFDEYPGLLGIMVSLNDYTIGANRGGELTSFSDFDIDFNKEKYLQETRLSGGLTKPFSAVVVTRAAGTLAVPTTPSFDGATNTITVPTAAGVFYTIDDEIVDGDVVITKPTNIVANPAEGFYLASNTTRDWTYAP